MMVLQALYKLVMWPIVFPHEALHYGAARALGVPAWLRWDRTLIEPCAGWKTVIIALTPFTVGGVLLVVCLAGWAVWAKVAPVSTLREHLAWSAVVWVLFWWTAASAQDLRSVWQFWRTKSWPEIERME